jgi:hypothetical protein
MTRHDALRPRNVRLSFFLAAAWIFPQVASAATLKWYKHVGQGDGTPQWQGPATAGTGWGGFKNVVLTSGGVFYALNAGGDLLWYRHDGRTDGKPNWGGGAGNKVGNGWGGFKSIHASNDGVLYAITTSGDLLWFKHTGIGSGIVSWGSGTGSKVGSGWGDFKKVVAAADGVFYAVNAKGQLLWYKHTGRHNGTLSWAPGAGGVVGNGWGDAKAIFAAPGNVLYLITQAGELKWFKHLGAATGSFSWGPGTGKTVGSGWGGFSAAFAGDDGVVYVLDPNDAVATSTPAAQPSPSKPAAEAPPPGASFDSAFLTKIQRDPFAALLPSFMSRPEAKGPLDAALSRVTEADGKLGEVLKTLAGLASDGDVLGKWKTKNVCVPTQVTVKGSCKYYADECASWGAPRCDVKCVRWGRVLKWVCEQTTKINCTSPCNRWRKTSTCLAWWPDEVKTSNTCSDVRYFDPTEGSIYKTARREAEQKLEEARREFDRIKNKVAADARKTFDDTTKAVSQFATKTWKDLSDAASDLYSKASSGARDLALKVFEFAGGVALELLIPLFGKAGSALGPAPMSPALSIYDQYVPSRRRASAAMQCKELTLFGVDPIKEISKAISFAAKLGLAEMRAVLGIHGTWTKLMSRAQQDAFLALGRWNDAKVKLGLPTTGWKRGLPGPLAEVARRAKYLYDFLRLQALVDGVEWAISKVKQAKTWFKQLPGRIAESVERAAKALRSSALADALSDFKIQAKNAKYWATEDIKAWAAKAASRIEDAVVKGGAKVKELGGSLERAFKKLFDGPSQPKPKHVHFDRVGEFKLKLAPLFDKIKNWPVSQSFAKWWSQTLTPAWRQLTQKLGTLTAQAMKATSAQLSKLASAGASVAKKAPALGRRAASLFAELWNIVKTVAQPVLSKIGKAAQATGAAGKQALAKLIDGAKKVGGKMPWASAAIVAVNWIAVGAAYLYADDQCKSETPGEPKIETNCGKYNHEDKKKCPTDYSRTAVCTCEKFQRNEGKYKACYAQKFTEFSKRAFFDALVGTAMEPIDKLVVTPMALGVTTAVTTAVALSFTPATAATTGAVIGFAARLAAIIVAAAVAEQQLYPGWFDKNVYYNGTVDKHFAEQAQKGAQHFWDKRAPYFDAPMEPICRAVYFDRVLGREGFSTPWLSNYGNWCGKGGSGKTMDKLDECCKAHDECYDKQLCDVAESRCMPACDKCDDAAVACWQRVRASNTKRFGTKEKTKYPCHACNTTSRSNPAMTSCDEKACSAK